MIARRQWRVKVEKGKPRAELSLVLHTIEVLGTSLATCDSPHQEDGRVHALVFHKVAHRVVPSHGQAVLLAVEAVDQVKRDLGLEIGQLQLVDVVPEQVGRRETQSARSATAETKPSTKQAPNSLLGRFICSPRFLSELALPVW
jgi:hypothetical protein